MEIANLIFFVYFVIELIVKIVGQGMKHFVKDNYNIFDSIVVSTSAVDIIMQYSEIQNKWGSGAITALRILRLVRMFEIGRVWNEFIDLMSAIKKTITDVQNTAILVIIFLFTFMLIGQEIYGYRVKFNKKNELDLSENGIYPESNFNTPLNAFLTVLIVLINEGWSEIY